jgi:MFS family permease
MFVFMALGVLYPLAVYALAGSALQLPAMFVTYFMMGCLAMVAAVIPSEAVPAHLRAKAMGLIMGVGEIVGGVLIPALAGILSDQINPSAFLGVSGLLAMLGLIFVTQLQEKPQLEK